MQHHFMLSQQRFKKQCASTKDKTAAVVLHMKSPSFFLQKTWDSYSMHIVKLSSSGIVIAAVSFYQAFTNAVLLSLYHLRLLLHAEFYSCTTSHFKSVWAMLPGGSGGDTMTVGANCVWLDASSYWNLFCAVFVNIKPLCVHTMWIYNTLLLKIGQDFWKSVTH